MLKIASRIIIFFVVALLSLAFGNPIRAAANGPKSAYGLSYRSGLPEELLFVPELNSLSSACIFKRVHAQQLPFEFDQGAVRTTQSRRLVPQIAHIIRMTIRSLSHVRFSSFYWGYRSQWSWNEKARRPVVLTTSINGIDEKNSKVNRQGRISLDCFTPLLHCRALYVSCLILCFGSLLLILAKKYLLLRKAGFQVSIQGRIINEVSKSTQGIVVQFTNLSRENSALSSALKTVCAERNSLQAQARRLIFERDNFKESLQQTIKRPSVSSSAIHSRFCEDSDVLGRYADREWHLKQQIEQANSNLARMTEEAKQSQLQLAQMRKELESARYSGDIEKQMTASLRAERDLYITFAKLSSAQKKHMANVLAELYEQQGRAQRRLERRVLKLMDWIIMTDNDFKDWLLAQQELVSALNATASILNRRITQSYSSSADTQGGLYASVIRCSALVQNIAAGLEAQGRNFERHLTGIQLLSDRIAQFAVNISTTYKEEKGNDLRQ